MLCAVTNENSKLKSETVLSTDCIKEKPSFILFLFLEDENINKHIFDHLLNVYHSEMFLTIIVSNFHTFLGGCLLKANINCVQ